MTEEKVSCVRLGNYLNGCVNHALEVLCGRNPGLDWDREQLIRLTVGYGLNRLFRQQPRVAVNFIGTCKKLYSDDEELNVIVDNVSRGGAGFRTVEENSIRVNEILRIEFFINNDFNTLVQTHVLVKHVEGRSIGAAFAEPELSGTLERFLAQAHDSA